MLIKRFQSGFTLVDMAITLFFLVIGLGGVIGWIINIVDVAHASFAHLTGMVVLRVVGIFVPPLGAVMGFIP